MEILQYIADVADAEIAVNPHVQTVIQPYITPSNKAKHITHTIKANANSVIKSGVDISSSIKEIPNRVCCVYEERVNKKSKVYKGTAVLADNEMRSHKNIGKWITAYYKITNISKPYEKKLKAKAKKHLEKQNHKKVYYEFNTYYQPIEIGEVIQLIYGDISVKGIVASIDMDLAIGGNMKVKIRKVG